MLQLHFGTIGGLGQDVVPDFEIRSHLRVLSRRRKLILLPVLLLVFSTVVMSYLQDPVFEGEAKVLLDQPQGESVLGDPSQAVDPARRLQTELEVVRSAAVRSVVEAQIGAIGKVEVSQVPDTDVISIKAAGPTRGRATEVARAYALAYLEYRRAREVDELEAAGRKLRDRIDSLQAQIDALDQRRRSADPASASTLSADREQLISQQALFMHRLDELRVEAELKTGGGRLVTDAISTTQVRPTPVRNGVLALVLGLMLTVGLAFAVEHLNDTIRTKEELDQALPGVRVLGIIPKADAAAEGTADARRVVTPLAPPGLPFGEAFLTLRTSIQFLGVERAPRVLQVTSAVPGEGKTSLTANLGVVFARAGQRVLMIDCDLRRARLHECFGIGNRLGFTSLLVESATPARVIQRVPTFDNLWLLPSGPLPMNPSELLGAQATSKVLAELAGRFDVIIIDSPPVLPITDALALSAWVDAVLLVVGAGSTSRRDVQRSAELLKAVEAPLVGTVLNRADAEENYGYAYAYSDDEGFGQHGRRSGRQRGRTLEPKSSRRRGGTGLNERRGQVGAEDLASPKIAPASPPRRHDEAAAERRRRQA